MPYETIEYKGHTIEIEIDHSPENPFEEWDCLPPLLVAYDGNLREYGEGGFSDDLPELTREEVKNNLAAILALLEDYPTLWAIKDETHGYDGYELDNESVLSKINSLLQSLYSEATLSFRFGKYCEKLTILSEVLTIKGVDHLLSESRGYSQGDYVEVLVISDEEGQNLQPTVDLYNSWAWGDVYGYNVEIENQDGDNIESCWDFYGDDHEKSGLLDHARDAIDYQIKLSRQKRLGKVKQLLKNKVALSKREVILSNMV